MSKVFLRDREYRPNDDEGFMNEQQREYFRLKLLRWRDDILRESRETLQHLQSESENHPDLADRASSETDRAIELRARDRQRKLIAKIDAALNRIDELLRGDRRADLNPPARSAADRDALGRGAGAARAQRARVPRRINLATSPSVR
jgi:RNA polymerase-binding protein DksA